ncbi:MAG: GrpB family protein [Bacteroidota bacterium]
MNFQEPIIISSYSEEWPDLFLTQAKAIREALGETAIRIDHIGSTAIQGTDAKPIIDMQISVASFEPLEAFKAPLEGLGYTFRADNPELTKRYFREKPGERRTHIHVRQQGSWHEQFALLFRDYLRINASDAQLYAQEKRRLAKLYRNDREAYANAKGKIIWQIMHRADRWAASTGWAIGERDM